MSKLLECRTILVEKAQDEEAQDEDGCQLTKGTHRSNLNFSEFPPILDGSGNYSQTLGHDQ